MPDERDQEDSPERSLTPIQDMAKDLGIDPSSIGSMQLKDIIKQGTDSTLFIARVSQVYYDNSHLQREIKTLNKTLSEETIARKKAEALVGELRESNAKLEKENEYYGSKAQNSVFSTILFALGSIAIGIAGSSFTQKDYQSASISAVIGLALSVFAAYLILKRRDS